MASSHHVSLHKSGQWHVKGVTADQPERRPSILVRSHKDRIPAGKYAVGLYLIFPDGYLRHANNPERASNPERWLDRAPYGGAVEIAVIKWDPTNRVEEWPGRAAGTQVFWAYTVNDKAIICLLHRSLGPNHPISTSSYEVLGRCIADIHRQHPNPRQGVGILPTVNPEGSLCIIEFTVGKFNPRLKKTERDLHQR